MASTAGVLHPDTTAVVVIDIQDRLAAAMAHRERVIASTALLLSVAAIVGLPMVVTRQYPKGLGDHADGDSAALQQAVDAGVEISQVDKVSFDCFAEPGFAEAIEGLGRGQLLLAAWRRTSASARPRSPECVPTSRYTLQRTPVARARTTTTPVRCSPRERGRGSDHLGVRGLRARRRGRYARVQSATGRRKEHVRAA